MNLQGVINEAVNKAYLEMEVRDVDNKIFNKLFINMLRKNGVSLSAKERKEIDEYGVDEVPITVQGKKIWIDYKKHYGENQKKGFSSGDWIASFIFDKGWSERYEIDEEEVEVKVGAKTVKMKEFLNRWAKALKQFISGKKKKPTEFEKFAQRRFEASKELAEVPKELVSKTIYRAAKLAGIKVTESKFGNSKSIEISYNPRKDSNDLSNLKDVLIQDYFIDKPHAFEDAKPKIHGPVFDREKPNIKEFLHNIKVAAKFICFNLAKNKSDAKKGDYVITAVVPSKASWEWKIRLRIKEYDPSAPPKKVLDRKKVYEKIANVVDKKASGIKFLDLDAMYQIIKKRLLVYIFDKHTDDDDRKEIRINLERFI